MVAESVQYKKKLVILPVRGLGLVSAEETWWDCAASPKRRRIAAPERSCEALTSITSYPRPSAHLSGEEEEKVCGGGGRGVEGGGVEREGRGGERTHLILALVV